MCRDLICRLASADRSAVNALRLQSPLAVFAFCASPHHASASRAVAGLREEATSRTDSKRRRKITWSSLEEFDAGRWTTNSSSIRSWSPPPSPAFPVVRCLVEAGGGGSSGGIWRAILEHARARGTSGTRLILCLQVMNRSWHAGRDCDASRKLCRRGRHLFRVHAESLCRNPCL